MDKVDAVNFRGRTYVADVFFEKGGGGDAPNHRTNSY